MLNKIYTYASKPDIPAEEMDRLSASRSLQLRKYRKAVLVVRTLSHRDRQSRKP